MIQRWLKKIHCIENTFLVLIFFLLTGFSLYQIIARNLFDGGVFWIEGASRVLVLWLALWGAAVAGRENRHIRIELLEKYLPADWVKYLDFVIFQACAAISALVAYHSARFVWQEKTYGDMAFASVPLWLCELVIPLVFALLAVRFCLHGWQALQGKPKG